MKHKQAKATAVGLANRVKGLAMKWWDYCVEGVWADTRSKWWIDLIRTANLSVRSFLDTDLQARASALTYQTMLAIVPALALMFAIGRGFGLQSVLIQELYKAFPAQKEALTTAFQFVDSYLSSASGGVFLGVGIVFLLWTLISLLSAVENSFNVIWGVKGRGFGRKITDYTAILMILPVLMICSSGMSLMMSTAIHTMLPFDFLTPAISVVLDVASLVITWLFFAGAYVLIPNTRVKFGKAFLAGSLAGTAFIALQWLFITGQVYVSRYNAIYGGFAFVPLLLLWLQLAWVICLSGGVLCYSSQNIFHYSFDSQIANISMDYRRKITLALIAIVAQRFDQMASPLTAADLTADYDIPPRLVSSITAELVDCGLLSQVIIDEKTSATGFQPAVPTHQLTLALVLKRLSSNGLSRFIPGFDSRFEPIISAIDAIDATVYANADKTLLTQLKINNITKN